MAPIRPGVTEFIRAGKSLLEMKDLSREEDRQSGICYGNWTYGFRMKETMQRIKRSEPIGCDRLRRLPLNHPFSTVYMYRLIPYSVPLG